MMLIDILHHLDSGSMRLRTRSLAASAMAKCSHNIGANETERDGF
jgi:hypothetical protein